jgi:cysteine desulfurase
LQGIFLSTGSACSSGTIEKPRIMQAMKVEKDFSESSIRISFGLENTKQEAEKFIQAWHQIYSKYYD